MDQVTTTYHFSAPPEAVWQCLMFYEDVPRRPWPLLRLVLPQPVRSEGDKRSVGAIVRCTYDRGYLIKRITAVEAPRHLRFEVTEQRLGIENRIRTCQGWYELRPTADAGTDVALTTYYAGRWRPRALWRAIEHYVGHRVHLHILRGMRERLASTGPVLASATAGADAMHIARAANR
jgi:Polyketide cyclase / dehydrase and lipid transport